MERLKPGSASDPLAVPYHAVGSEFRSSMILAVIAVLVSAVSLAEFYGGAEIVSWDMTFYWDVARRHFFEKGTYWWDACANGFSLPNNPLYGLFSITNWPMLIFPNFIAQRVEAVSFFAFFALTSWLWLRTMGFSRSAIFTTVLFFCASGLVTTLIWRNKPFLYPLVWLPAAGVCGHYAITSLGKMRGAFWGLLIGISAGAGFLAGDVLMPIFCLLVAMSTQWFAVANIRLKLQWSRLLSVYGAAAIGLFLTICFTWSDINGIQLVSMRRHGMPVDEVLSYSFHPIRILEFIYPFLGANESPEFIGQKYTSAYGGGTNWWYASVTFGIVGFLLSVAGLILAVKKKPFLGFLLSIGLLMFIAFGKWNPVVGYVVEHFSALRFIRYPAKVVMGAAVLMFPIVAFGTSEFLNWCHKNFTSDRANRIFYIVVAFGVLIPTLGHPPFKVIGIRTDTPPEILRGLEPTDTTDNRMLFIPPNRHAKITGENLLAFHFSSNYWGLKAWGCPEATMSYGQIIVPDAWYTSASREHWGISHVIIDSKIGFDLQEVLKKGDLHVAARDKNDDTILLTTNTPPKRFSLVSEWRLLHPPMDPFPMNLTAPNVYVVGDLFLDERGYVKEHQNSEFNHSLESVPLNSCEQSITGKFDSVNAVGEFSASSECPGLFLLNVRFAPGWHAEVNGIKTPIVHVNQSMIGIHVPAGKSELKLRNSPHFPSGFPETSLALQGVLALGLASLFLRKKK